MRVRSVRSVHVAADRTMSLFKKKKKPPGRATLNDPFLLHEFIHGPIEPVKEPPSALKGRRERAAAEAVSAASAAVTASIHVGTISLFGFRPNAHPGLTNSVRPVYKPPLSRVEKFERWARGVRPTDDVTYERETGGHARRMLDDLTHDVTTQHRSATAGEAAHLALIRRYEQRRLPRSKVRHHAHARWCQQFELDAVLEQRNKLNLQEAAVARDRVEARRGGTLAWDAVALEEFKEELDEANALPEGWEEVPQTYANRSYFYNATTGETQWERPEEWVPPPPPKGLPKSVATSLLRLKRRKAEMLRQSRVERDSYDRVIIPLPCPTTCDPDEMWCAPRYCHYYQYGECTVLSGRCRPDGTCCRGDEHEYIPLQDAREWVATNVPVGPTMTKFSDALSMEETGDHVRRHKGDMPIESRKLQHEPLQRSDPQYKKIMDEANGCFERQQYADANRAFRRASVYAKGAVRRGWQK